MCTLFLHISLVRMSFCLNFGVHLTAAKIIPDSGRLICKKTARRFLADGRFCLHEFTDVIYARFKLLPFTIPTVIRGKSQKTGSKKHKRLRFWHYRWRTVAAGIKAIGE